MSAWRAENPYKRIRCCFLKESRSKIPHGFRHTSPRRDRHPSYYQPSVASRTSPGTELHLEQKERCVGQTTMELVSARQIFSDRVSRISHPGMVKSQSSRQSSRSGYKSDSLFCRNNQSRYTSFCIFTIITETKFNKDFQGSPLKLKGLYGKEQSIISYSLIMVS